MPINASLSPVRVDCEEIKKCEWKTNTNLSGIHIGVIHHVFWIIVVNCPSVLKYDFEIDKSQRTIEFSLPG